MHLVAALCALVFFATARTPDDSLLDRVTEYARRYESQMPDFVCTRITRRSQQKSNGEWKLLDTVEDEVAYSAGREHMRVVSINGKPAKTGARASGFNSSGEFGGTLTYVFSPDSHTAFEFHPPDVFDFRVARVNSAFTVRQGGKGSVTGFHGNLTVRDDGAVLKLHLETEPVPELNLSSATQEVEFAPTAIAGRQFMLASRAMALLQVKNTPFRREMVFRNYRKYDADSTLNFTIPK